jgi:hypothetical protein
MAEKIEIEIIAKGKPAEKAIGRVEDKTDKLGKTTKRVGKDTDGVLAKMRLGWLAVGAATAGALRAAATFERASLGLTESQKKWARSISETTDVTAEQIASFMKSAQTAGLNEEKMKDLALQAVALGYAFPHEDAETLHDNLVMLHATGEAQGFMVDILEQKYAKLGVSFEDLDLKTRSSAEKLALVAEVVEKSQRQMDASKFKEYNKAVNILRTSFSKLGEGFIELMNTLRIDKALDFMSVTFKGVTLLVDSVVGLFDKSKESTLQLAESTLDFGRSLEKLFGMDLSKWLAGTEAAVHVLNKELGVTSSVLGVVEDNIESLTITTERKLSPFAERVKDTAKSIEDAFVDMAFGAKNAFQDLMKSIVAAFVRAQIRKNIIDPLSKTGLFEFLTPNSDHAGTAQVKHTGGHINSYHTGYRSDERLAKLQVGESVINRHGTAKNKQAIDAMNAGMSVGGGGQVINVTYSPQVNALDPSTAASVIAQNAPTIVGVVRQAFNRNGQSVKL